MSQYTTCRHHCCREAQTHPFHEHPTDPEECDACSLLLHNLALAKGKVEEAEDQLAQAIEEQKQRAHDSMMIDRTSWTEKQWIEDAIRLMNEPHGAITSLVNGHVMRLIDFYQRYEGGTDE